MKKILFIAVVLMLVSTVAFAKPPGPGGPGGYVPVVRFLGRLAIQRRPTPLRQLQTEHQFEC